jgi:triacylglycerol esterase/lipase EstA (alpha/beta hydrolase family)
MPLRNGLLLALLLATLLAVLPARPAHAAGPALSVAGSDLAAALSCPRSLAGATRAPVLLIPGTALEPRANFDWNYEPALDAAGIPWCALTVPRYGTGDIQETGEYVVHALRRMHAESGRRVSIVGFSQGGMVGRWALKWWPDTRAIVEDLVGLSPSNHGTLSARAVCLAICPPSFWQQLDGARFIAALNDGGETFAGIDYTVAYTRYDEIVVPNVDHRRLRHARVTGGGRRVRVRRRHGRLVAVIDLRRRSGVVTVRIRGVTRHGRKVSQTRRYRACGSRPSAARA